MKTNCTSLTCAVLAAGLCLASAQAPERMRLGVGAVTPSKALEEDMARTGKSIEMRRVTEALDGHLISALTKTRKFDIVARSDLKDLLKEQDLAATGIINPETGAEQGKIKGLQYIVLTRVDGFLEENVEATFPGTGRKATKRRFQLSCQAKITDTSTGSLLDAPNFQIEKVDTITRDDNQVSDAKRTDELMPAITREMAERVANRVVDLIFPAKILDREEKIVTINRGDGMNMRVGEIWNVYGPTKEIRDPDSGAIIKRKGGLLGKVRITSVEPAYSQGEVLEDKGIGVGAVLSRPQEGGTTGN